MSLFYRTEHYWLMPVPTPYFVVSVNLHNTSECACSWKTRKFHSHLALSAQQCHDIPPAKYPQDSWKSAGSGFLGTYSGIAWNPSRLQYPKTRDIGDAIMKTKGKTKTKTKTKTKLKQNLNGSDFTVIHFLEFFLGMIPADCFDSSSSKNSRALHPASFAYIPSHQTKEEKKIPCHDHVMFVGYRPASACITSKDTEKSHSAGILPQNAVGNAVLRCVKSIQGQVYPFPCIKSRLRIALPKDIRSMLNQAPETITPCFQIRPGESPMPKICLSKLEPRMLWKVEG